MSLPPAIPLVTHGACPHCGQDLLGLAQARCTHCGRSLVPAFEGFEPVGERLREMAPGWTVPDLLGWVRPRPGQLAWVHQNQQWPLLGHFVAEDLWSAWQQWERARRSRGLSLQVEGVEVDAVHLVGLGEWEPWAQVRIHGRRAVYEWDLTSQLAQAGATSPGPFTELWWLRPTGMPAHRAALRCSGCGGEVAFDHLVCGYCGRGVERRPGPWQVVKVQVLQEALGVSGWGDRAEAGWEWVLENLIC